MRATFGGGYVGAQLEPQGHALGAEAVRRFGLKAGDTAIVVGQLRRFEPRHPRGSTTEGARRRRDLTVVQLNAPPEWAADPNLGIPSITAAIQANPDVKLIAYPGGQLLGNAPTYMEAAGKKPGEIINIGFDTSPQIVEAFKNGWVQLTSDQQPFLQGYMPILSLCQQVVYGLGAMNVDTGAGFVTTDNYEAVADPRHRRPALVANGRSCDFPGGLVSPGATGGRRWPND